jgi:Flp pilus assembly pilin Flp
MNIMLLNLCMKHKSLMSSEEGQDLVEYALLVSLLALASITLIRGVASSVVSSYATISAVLAAAV